MKKIFVSFVISLFVSIAFGQFPHPDTSYFFLFGNNNTDEFRDACNHSIDSGYVMVGSSSSYSANGTDIFIVKTDWRGKTLWSRTIGGTGMEKGFAIKETPDKGFIIGGYGNSNSQNDYNMLLIKTDSTGLTEWQKNYGGADWDFLYSVALCPDSGYLLCGETYSFGNLSSDIYIIRTNKNGDTIWTKTYGGVGKDAANKIIYSSDGTVVAAGYSESNSIGLKDLYLIKCNYSNGDSIFSVRYGGQYNEEAKSLIEHTAFDSGYVMVGYTESYTTAHDKDIILIKFSKNGSFMWEDNFGNAGGNDEATCIVNQGISFFVSGYTANGAGVYDLAAGVVDLFGNWQWNQSTSYGSYQADFAWANLKTLRNHFGFIGSTESFGANDQDAMLILTDTIQFQYQKVGSNNDSLVSLEQTPYKPKVKYLNPANELLIMNINYHESENALLKIIDNNGKVLMTTLVNTQNKANELNITNLPNGLYSIILELPGQIVHCKLCVLH